jgi:hypothetical protein
MFFEYGDSLLPLSDIKSCTTDAHNTTTVVLKDGRVLKSKGFYSQYHIAAMAARSVCALPGYYKISIPKQGVVMDENWPVVPIVAWRIVGEFNFAEPITMEMDEDLAQHYAVLCPNGEVHDPSGGFPYKSIDDFFKIMNSRNASQPSQENSVKNGAAPSSSKLTVELELDSATAKAIARQHRKN